jgi:flagellar protein FliS
MDELTARRAAQAYRGAATHVPPLTAVVKLLDGASSLLLRTAVSLEAKKFEEGHDCLTRATAILRGLSFHLNFDRGGEVAERLMGTYNAIILAALRSFGRPNAPECYRRLVASLTELRNAWAFVAGIPQK